MTKQTVRTVDDGRISDAVIEAVSSATGTDTLALPPLYGTVDPDRLDGLFPYDDEDRRVRGRVEFTFAGCDVTVHAGGRVVAVPSVQEPESRPQSTR